MNHLHPSDYSIGSMSRADLERIKREADKLNAKERASKESEALRLAQVKTMTAVAIFMNDSSHLYPNLKL
jgi:hypothetical protein